REIAAPSKRAGEADPGLDVRRVGGQRGAILANRLFVPSRPCEHARPIGAKARVAGLLFQENAVFGDRFVEMALPREDPRQKEARVVVLGVIHQLRLKQRDRLDVAVGAHALPRGLKLVMGGLLYRGLVVRGLTRSALRRGEQKKRQKERK